MNWLGRIISKEIKEEDKVLDLGCGIMQATMYTLEPDRIKCKLVVGVDAYEPYIKRISNIENVVAIHAFTEDIIDGFMDKSFDIVIALDFLEHLEECEIDVIVGEMERIARKKVIIYTPKEFKKQDTLNPYGMGENELQQHKSLIKDEWLIRKGYTIYYPQESGNILAIKEMGQ